MPICLQIAQHQLQHTTRPRQGLRSVKPAHVQLVLHGLAVFGLDGGQQLAHAAHCHPSHPSAAHPP
jgi:hypothetical protein